MDIEVHGEYVIGVTALDAPGIAPEPALNPVQLLGCALAQCTYSVLASYAERLAVDPTGMAMRAELQVDGAPRRVSRIVLDVRWPELPESRLDAATRAARHCTVHATLAPGVEVDVLVDH